MATSVVVGAEVGVVPGGFVVAELVLLDPVPDPDDVVETIEVEVVVGLGDVVLDEAVVEVAPDVAVEVAGASTFVVDDSRTSAAPHAVARRASIPATAIARDVRCFTTHSYLHVDMTGGGAGQIHHILPR